MPKIRITCEVEIGDLASFFPDDPPGSSRENLVSFVRGLHLRAFDQRIDAIQEENVAIKEALLQHIDDDVKLAERVMESLVIETVP
jgi:hypothetical protein